MRREKHNDPTLKILIGETLDNVELLEDILGEELIAAWVNKVHKNEELLVTKDHHQAWAIAYELVETHCISEMHANKLKEERASGKFV